MKLFITGATGFLGSELIPIIAGEYEHLYLLVRKQSLLRAKQKYADYSNVSFIAGDLTNPDALCENAKSASSSVFPTANQ